MKHLRVGMTEGFCDDRVRYASLHEPLGIIVQPTLAVALLARSYKMRT
jgi:hypothetical protein